MYLFRERKTFMELLPISSLYRTCSEFIELEITTPLAFTLTNLFLSSQSHFAMLSFSMIPPCPLIFLLTTIYLKNYLNLPKMNLEEVNFFFEKCGLIMPLRISLYFPLLLLLLRDKD